MSSHIREYGVGRLTKRLREVGAFKDAPSDKKLLVVFCVSTVAFMIHFVMFSTEYTRVDFKTTKAVDEFLKVSQTQGFDKARELYPQFKKDAVQDCPRGFTCISKEN